MDDIQERELIEKLITLTENGILVWQDITTPFSNNAFKVVCEGVEFQTEWLQDDRPKLFADGVLIIEHRYKLDRLIQLLFSKFRKPLEPIKGVAEYQKETKQTRQAKLKAVWEVLTKL